MFSREDFVLKRLLLAAYFPELEVCHRILSGLSMIKGGFGSGWDLVLILCEARLFFKNERDSGFKDCFWEFYLSRCLI